MPANPRHEQYAAELPVTDGLTATRLIRSELDLTMQCARDAGELTSVGALSQQLVNEFKRLSDGGDGAIIASAAEAAFTECAELAEYVLGLDLGIDTPFAVPFVGLDALYPGRMSGNTIACGSNR